jgi:hypothetical protein
MDRLNLSLSQKFIIRVNFISDKLSNLSVMKNSIIEKLQF